MTGSRHTGKTAPYARTFFATRGDGPWACTGCGRLVTKSQVCIHHVDFDPDNHDPFNLAPMHRRCHLRLHRDATDPRILRAQAQAGGRALAGQPKTPEHRAALAAAQTGRIDPQPVRRHKAAAATRAWEPRRVLSPAQRKEVRARSAAGATQVALALDFGVSRSAVQRALKERDMGGAD